MRVIVFIRANEESEAGVMPSEQMIDDMTAYNEELLKSGVMLAGEGLYPSSKGKRVVFSGGKSTVIDGPFSETKELVAGYYIWQVKSIEEAVEWVKRMPNSADGPEDVIEIRPIFEYEDWVVDYPPGDPRQRSRDGG